MGENSHSRNLINGKCLIRTAQPNLRKFDVGLLTHIILINLHENQWVWKLNDQNVWRYLQDSDYLARKPNVLVVDATGRIKPKYIWCVWSLCGNFRNWLDFAIIWSLPRKRFSLFSAYTVIFPRQWNFAKQPHTAC